MKRALALIAAGVAASAVAPTPARAWDELGHRVVARIAWETMTPQARAASVALLRDASTATGLPLLWAHAQATVPDYIREREFFTQAAVWSDIVRDPDFVGNPFHRPSWHYVNYFWRQDRPGGPAILVERPAAGDLVTRLIEFSQTVDSEAVPREERAVQLAWILHQVGDIHQPVHTSARITDQSPEGDRGANDFALAGRSNLHSFWDQALTRTAEWAPEDMARPWAYMSRLASALMARTPAPPPPAQVAPAPADAWARESFGVAQTLYPASLRPGLAPPAAYQRRAADIAANRIALAGYRLGDLLNRTLGS